MDRRNAMILGAAATLGGLPVMRPDQQTDPPPAAIVPGARGVFRGRLLIISGGNPPGSGVYIYTPSVAAGNLIATVANSGTDAKGNHVNPGLASYSLVGPRFVSIFQSGGQVLFATAATEAGPYTVQGIINIDATTNALTLTGSSNNGVVLTSQGSGNVTAAVLLKALAALSVTGGITTDTELISSGQAGGLLLRVVNSTAAPTAPSVRLDANAAGDSVLGIRVTGDSFNRSVTDSTGKTQLGGGALAPETTAPYRAAAFDQEPGNPATVQTPAGSN